ncbi:polymorphic toxin type 50 domain-containing protein [Limosilactobacillus oris]|uniref:polymorphic toxin type 50 domain-containing protein n=1 Tax=Limosilactobacillus oris TaxID=1632 RepID=UPI00388D364C
MMTREPTKLSKDVYSQADQFVDELKEKYHLTERQIEAIMSQYLGKEYNRSTLASNAHKKELVSKLDHMYKQASQSDRQLILASMANRSLHTVADIASAEVAIELIRLASWRKKQIKTALQSIPQKVWNSGYQKVSQSVTRKLTQRLRRRPTQFEHQTELMHKLQTNGHPYNHRLTQRAIAQIAKNNASGVEVTTAINRDTVQMMNITRDMVNKAIQNHAAIQDFAHDFVKKFYGTDQISSGDLYRAERLLRPEYTYTYTNARRIDMQQRGVEYYTNVAIGARNTCRHCMQMDGTVFKVSEMEAGVNAPPFHPNCQCEVIETPASEVAGSNLFSKNQEYLDELNNSRKIDYSAYGKNYTRSLIQNGDWGRRINLDKQKDHMESTAREGKSYLFDHEDPQKLLDKYTGHGSLFMTSKGFGNTETVRVDHYVGVDYNTGKRTKWIRIHHSKKRTHIVPILQEGKGE